MPMATPTAKAMPTDITPASKEARLAPDDPRKNITPQFVGTEPERGSGRLADRAVVSARLPSA
jgi:hypothetical protein